MNPVVWAALLLITHVDCSEWPYVAILTSKNFDRQKDGRRALQRFVQWPIRLELRDFFVGEDKLGVQASLRLSITTHFLSH